MNDAPGELRGPFPFDRPFHWSRQKLDILEKYTVVAAKILSRFRRVTFVDLMAGEGMYDTGDLGSTGRFAGIAADYAERGRRVRVIAFEANAAAFARLEANTADSRAFVDVRRGRWQDSVPSLLEELRGEFVIFFVDPMGLLPWASIEPLVKRPDTEILINFASVTAARLVGKWRSGGMFKRGAGLSLTRTFGGRTWLSFAEDASVEDGDLYSKLAQHYGELLAKAGKYGIAGETIRKDGIVGIPKYHLLFASRQPLAFEIMNDVLATQTEQLRREAITGLNPFGPEQQMRMSFDSAVEKANAEQVLITQLAEDLLDDPSLHFRIMSAEDFFRAAIDTRFGDYRKTLYRRALFDVLDKRGSLTVHVRERSTWKSIIEIY